MFFWTDHDSHAVTKQNWLLVGTLKIKCSWCSFLSLNCIRLNFRKNWLILMEFIPYMGEHPSPRGGEISKIPKGEYPRQLLDKNSDISENFKKFWSGGTPWIFCWNFFQRREYFAKENLSWRGGIFFQHAQKGFWEITPSQQHCYSCTNTRVLIKRSN